MISIYNYEEFRPFLRDRFQEMPKKGYGQSFKLAHYLGVHTTLVSQILKGKKVFSLEQAQKVTEYFGLLESEADYFLLLVQKEKAGSPALKAYFDKKRTALKAEAARLVHRLQSNRTLDEATRAVFYSHWKYSAVRQLTALPEQSSLETIAQTLNLPLRVTKEVMDFLVRTGLCAEKGGRFAIGPSSTHLESESPWTYVNLCNWRQKAMEEFRKESRAKLHYSCPMTLSRQDAERVRESIVKLLEELDGIIGPSPSEEMHCLNIDWFGIS